MSEFDCIVIGGGIGGLCAAGRLAAEGVNVLLLEKNPTPGGYLQSFRRRGITFDSSVDCFSGFDARGPFTTLLRSLGVEDELSTVTVDPVRTSVFPGITVKVWSDVERYIEEIKRLFPGDAKGIESLFGVLRLVYSEIEEWADSITGMEETERIPVNILKHRTLTYGQLLDDHISDEKLKAVLSDRCPFIGLPPAEISAVAMIALVMSYFKSGAYRVIGGSQNLADTIVKGISKSGGEVLFRKRVVEIVTRDGKAVGVRTDDGCEYSSKFIISAMDFNRTFRELLKGCGAVSEAALNQPLQNVSSSFFILYIGAKADLSQLGQSSSIGVYPAFDMDANFAEGASFKPETTFGITIPTISDASMAPPGIHSLSVHEMVNSSYGNWKEIKGKLTECVLKKIGNIIPEIEKSLVHMEAATPDTLERYTGNTKGAAYGWRHGPNLKPCKTFIHNLYLAGHWEGIGGGVVTAAYSGLNTANRILRNLCS